MHEIHIAGARYLAEDSVATAVSAVSASVEASRFPVTVEFPIIPRSTPEDWGVINYVRVMLLPDAPVVIEPSTALEFSPAEVQTIRIHAEPDPRFRQIRGPNEEAGFAVDVLDDLGYDLQ